MQQALALRVGWPRADKGQQGSACRHSGVHLRGGRGSRVKQQVKAAATGSRSAGSEDPVPAARLSAQEEQRVDGIAALLSVHLDSLAEDGDDDWQPATAELEALETAMAGLGGETAAPGVQQRRVGRRARGADATAPPDSTSSLPDEILPKVAIVGRPNVGKSALFNRIVGQQVAIVYDYPGVTRDRLYTRAFWGGREFMLVDTGGLMTDAAKLPRDQQASRGAGSAYLSMHAISAAGLPAAIERQAAAAVEEADALVLVVDGQSGSTATDEEILAWLRRSHPGKPIALAVNKCENAAKADLQAAEFWGTGLEPVPVSAISGSGTGELMERLVASLPPPPRAGAGTDADAGSAVAVAIVGRPNVGKSSLLNSLAGEERSIVSSVAGTTRDAIDTQVTTTDGRTFKLVDTAGVRKRTAVASSKDGAESLSVERAFRAVRRSEVAVLVLDATEGITQQDFRLAEYIAAEGRACVVVVNKWDAMPVRTSASLAEFEAGVRAQLRPVEWANIVFTSAKTGQRVKRVLDAVTAAAGRTARSTPACRAVVVAAPGVRACARHSICCHTPAEEHRRRITTSTLNLVLSDAAAWRQPPTTGSGRRGRVYYGTQAGVRPPSFVLFVNDPALFPEDYRKFIERQLRENVGFPGSPLRLLWRGKRGSMELSS
eukprot:scaffold2.g6783.t1